MKPPPLSTLLTAAMCAQIAVLGCARPISPMPTDRTERIEALRLQRDQLRGDRRLAIIGTAVGATGTVWGILRLRSHLRDYSGDSCLECIADAGIISIAGALTIGAGILWIATQRRLNRNARKLRLQLAPTPGGSTAGLSVHW